MPWDACDGTLPSGLGGTIRDGFLPASKWNAQRSTCVFHFPNERAAEIAVETVRRYKVETGSKIKVVFNVFKDLDKTIYERLLGANCAAAARA